MIIRNSIGLIGASALYLVLLYVLQFLGLKDRDALLLIFIFHVGFGVLGYFIYTGRILLRAALVFLVIVICGVVREFVYPDPRHELLQVIISIPLGLLAAVTALGGGLLERIWIRCRAKFQL